MKTIDIKITKNHVQTRALHQPGAITTKDPLTHLNEREDTLFHYAAYTGQLNVLQAFTASHPELDVNMVNTEGNSALHYAAANGHAKVVTFLLNKGARPTLPNKDGNTPLHFAAQNPQAVRELLAKTPDKFARNDQGERPYDSNKNSRPLALPDNPQTLTEKLNALSPEAWIKLQTHLQAQSGKGDKYRTSIDMMNALYALSYEDLDLLHSGIAKEEGVEEEPESNAKKNAPLSAIIRIAQMEKTNVDYKETIRQRTKKLQERNTLLQQSFSLLPIAKDAPKPAYVEIKNALQNLELSTEFIIQAERTLNENKTVEAVEHIDNAISTLALRPKKRPALPSKSELAEEIQATKEQIASTQDEVRESVSAAFLEDMPCILEDENLEKYIQQSKKKGTAHPPSSPFKKQAVQVLDIPDDKMLTIIRLTMDYFITQKTRDDSEAVTKLKMRGLAEKLSAVLNPYLPPAEEDKLHKKKKNTALPNNIHFLSRTLSDYFDNINKVNEPQLCTGVGGRLVYNEARNEFWIAECFEGSSLLAEGIKPDPNKEAPAHYYVVRSLTSLKEEEGSSIVQDEKFDEDKNLPNATPKEKAESAAKKIRIAAHDRGIIGLNIEKIAADGTVLEAERQVTLTLKTLNNPLSRIEDFMNKDELPPAAFKALSNEIHTTIYKRDLRQEALGVERGAL